MADYARIQQTPAVAAVASGRADSTYWHTLKKRSAIATIGAPTSLQFDPNDADSVLITSGSRLSKALISSKTAPTGFAQFKSAVFSGSFRPDGKLVICGTTDGTVEMLEAATGTKLRSLRAHHGATHFSAFSATDLYVAASGGRDGSFALWDVTMGHESWRCVRAHSDVVKCGVCTSAGLFCTGGYDGYVRLWDPRSDTHVHEFEHGTPVEAVALLGGGRLIAVGGGDRIVAWDPLSQRGAVQETIVRAKGVSALVASEDDTHLLFAGLNGSVRALRTSDFLPTSNILKANAPILSLALAPTGSAVAAGTSKSELHAKWRAADAPAPAAVKGGRGRRRKDPDSTKSRKGDIEGTMKKKPLKDSRVDMFLKKFQHVRALEFALRSGGVTLTAAVLRELEVRGQTIWRNTLAEISDSAHVELLNVSARAFRDAQDMAPVLRALRHVLSTPRGLGQGLNPACDRALQNLQARARQEAECMCVLTDVHGMLQTIVEHHAAPRD